MNFSILTLFPEMFSGPFDQSIVKRARDKRLVDIRLINIREFATDRYKSVDDHPYGGGHGMILRVDVVDRALQFVLSSSGLPPARRASGSERPEDPGLDSRFPASQHTRDKFAGQAGRE